ncbi:MAG: hypothetical protein GF331_14615, partial [Chitinivibrionales bacterium]|nr:hypothetical protein [Chitinivibrionales bacterium]
MKRVLLLLIFCHVVCFGRTVYVTSDGTGDGSSWAAALGSVQDGINAAIDGDTVLLDNGRYHEHNIHLFGKQLVIGSRYVLDDDTAHVSACIVDGDSTHGDSGSVFCLLSPCDSGATVLKGFTITNGTGTGATHRKGGGVYIETGWLTLERMVIRNNVVTGADYTYGGNGGAIGGGNLVLRGCHIHGNTVTSSGGGITGSDSPTVCYAHNSRIVGNAATGQYRDGWAGGGAIASHECTLLLDSCLIANNSVSNRDDHAAAGVWVARCRVRHTTISNNTGGFGIGIVGMSSLPSDASVFDTCTIDRNGTYGLKLQGSLCYLTGCAIVDNTTWGIVGSDPTCTFSRCIVAGNGTGALDLSTNDHVLEHCVLVDNAGVLTNAGNSYIFKNSIVEGSAGGNSIALEYTLAMDDLGGVSIVDNGGNLFGADPRFVNAAGGDFHLLGNSPAIDAGDPTLECVNELCADPCRINMGVYGNTAEATCKSNNAHMVLSPPSFSRTLVQGEVRYDTIVVTNSSADPMTIRGMEDIVINDADLVCTGVSKVNTVLEQDDTCLVYLRLTASAARTDTVRVKCNFEATNSGATVDYEVTVTGQTCDDLFVNDWDFGDAQILETKQVDFYLKNNGSNAIFVSEMVESSDYFALVSGHQDIWVPAGDSVAVTATFSPQAIQPYQTRVVLHSPQLAVADSTLRLSGNGIDAEPPVVAITDVAPDTVVWGQTYSVTAEASDGDALGADPQIVSHSWTVDGRLVFSGNGIASAPSESLSIGWNTIIYTAQDNEGVWADTAVDSILLVGLPPAVDTLYAARGLV